MIIERPSAAESVLQNVGPGTAGLVIAAQRRERHSEVPRRQAVKFVGKPAGRSAVVSDRYDRGQVVGHPAQRRQRRGQSMPTTEGHHSRERRTQRARRDEARHFAGAHSRPRSRCRTVVGNPVRAAAGPTPPPWLSCDACRRYNRWRVWRTAYPRRRNPPTRRPSAPASNEERLRARLAEYIVAHRFAQTGLRSKLRNPVGIGQKAHIEDHVCIYGNAVLEAERQQRHA